MDRILVVSTRSNEPSLIVFEVIDRVKHNSKITQIGLRLIDDEQTGWYTLQPIIREIGLNELYDILQTNNRITCYNLERKSSKNVKLKKLAGACLYNHYPNKVGIWSLFANLFTNQGDVTEFFTKTSDWMWLTHDFAKSYREVYFDKPIPQFSYDTIVKAKASED